MFDINKDAGLGEAAAVADDYIYVEVGVAIGPVGVAVGVGVEF